MRKKKYFSFLTLIGEILFVAIAIGSFVWLFSTKSTNEAGHFLEIIGVVIAFRLVYKCFFEINESELEEIIYELLEEEYEDELDKEEYKEENKMDKIFSTIRFIIEIISLIISYFCLFTLGFTKQTKGKTMLLVIVCFLFCMLGHSLCEYESYYEYYDEDE